MIKSFKHRLDARRIWNDGPEFENFMGRDGAPAISQRHLCSGGGGGKSGNSTQSQSQNSSTAGSAQAQADADTVWNKALTASNLPFQSYAGEFVSPFNQQQNTGVSGINHASGMYAPYGQQATQTLAPYFGQATQTLGQGLSAGQGLTGAGVGLTAANANLDPNSVSQWESPYISNVVRATENQQNQQNQQQQSQLEGSAISSGAFGGDRSGVAAANLAYQQNLANQPVIANLYNTGYQQALGAAQQQQQTGLQAGAQLGALGNQFYNQGLGGSQQYANLGSGLSSAYSNLGTTAQTNALNAAQAQLGAGTLQQQTGQAQDTALYNQFLQKQAYPFQTAQFLSNILQGVAPVYGTNTTTNATGTASSPTSFFQRGGRVGRAAGGLSSANDNSVMAQLLAAQAQMYPGSNALYGSSTGAGGPYGVALSQHGGMQLPQAHLLQPLAPPQSRGGARAAMQDVNAATQFGDNLGKIYTAGKGAIVGTPQTTAQNGAVIPATGGWGGYGGKWGANAPVAPNAQGAASNVIYLDPNGVPVNTNAGISAAAPSAADPNDYGGTYRRGGRVGLAYGGIPYATQINDPIVPADIADPTAVTRPQEAALLRWQQMRGPQNSSGSGFSNTVGGLNSLFSLGKNFSSLFGGSGGGAGGGFGGIGGGLSSGLGGGLGEGAGAGAGDAAGGLGSGLGDLAAAFRRGGRAHRDAGGSAHDNQWMQIPGGIIGGVIGSVYGGPMGGMAGSKAGENAGSMFGDAFGGNWNGVGEDFLSGVKGGLQPPQMPGMGGGGGGFPGLSSGGRARRDTGGGAGDPVILTPVDHNVGNIIDGQGGFNGYATPQEGVAATIRNAQAYPEKFNGGKPMTSRQIAEHWAPKDNGKDPMLKGNDPEAWAKSVAGFAGMKPDDPVDLSDPKIAAVFAQGVHRQEKGPASGFDPAIYDQGARLAFSGDKIVPVRANSAPTNQQVALAGPPPQGLSGAQSQNVTPGPQSWWDKESGGLSGTERAIVTALSGLGGMASSPSRFLGGALLSGLGAGANTYAGLAQKGMGLDIAQQQANTAQTAKGLVGMLGGGAAGGCKIPASQLRAARRSQDWRSDVFRQDQRRDDHA